MTCLTAQEFAEELVIVSGDKTGCVVVWRLVLHLKEQCLGVTHENRSALAVCNEDVKKKPTVIGFVPSTTKVVIG